MDTMHPERVHVRMAYLGVKVSRNTFTFVHAFII